MNDINAEKRLLDKNSSMKLFEGFSESGNNLYKGKDIQFRDYLAPSLAVILSALDTLGGDRLKYLIDIKTGIQLYSLLPPAELGMRSATNDDFWRYISIEVLPDLVFKRWGLVKDRFWEKSNRIWLKTVWWYVHLSWQNSLEKTKEYLSKPGLSTDTIAQLVERSGRHGYRIDLYRCIMAKTIENNFDQTEFRALMTLNTVRSVSLEPRFFDGGIPGYVNDLINRVRKIAR